jgi:hypothetical protein
MDAMIMGRWDHFKKDGDRNWKGMNVDVSNYDIEKLKKQLPDSMSETDKKRILDKMVELFDYTKKQLDAKDERPIDSHKIIAMLCLLYEQHGELNNPTAVAASVIEIAKHEDFNPNTFRAMMKVVQRIIRMRFGV